MSMVSQGAAAPSFVSRLPLTTAALEFARDRHDGQTRVSDEAPFVLHPLEVAALLHTAGEPDHVVAAGVLHDVLEDTDVDHAELHDRFGPAVASLVAAVSENPRIHPESERKAALRAKVAAAGREAALIFAADKVAKARELRLRKDDEAGDTSQKFSHYCACLAVVEEVVPEHPLVEQLRFELEALSAFPPAALPSGGPCP